jgi:hypothetical protein
MKITLLYIVFIPYVALCQTVAVSFCDSIKIKSVMVESCYKANVFQKDTLAFFTNTTSYQDKYRLITGYYEEYLNGVLATSGYMAGGNPVGVRKDLYPNGKVKEIDYFSKGHWKKTVYYNSNGKRDSVERNYLVDWKEVHYQLFNDYQAGIQPPTLFDWSIPTGFTVSGFNVSCDIPMPQYAFETRTKLVFAPEVGVSGCGLRLGLSPFNNDYWDFIRNDTLISFTLLTINASMTYIWKGHAYELIDPVLSNRWYVGADLDFSYLLGHIRLGAFKLISPEPNRDWNFMISLGLSPAIPVFLYALFTIAE